MESLYDEVQTKTTNNAIVSSTSSGYGASVKSALSIFVNLDNYFYDENFSKIKDRAQENTQLMKSNVINCLLDYQIEYLRILKAGLESHVRPLSAVMESQTFFQIFMNIEKIHAITEFIRNSINESYTLTMDTYQSTVTIIHEYISLFISTYETYLSGYPVASACVKKSEFVDLYNMISSMEDGFDLADFIELPVNNIKKIFCAFNSLLEMTPISESDDYDRLSTICNQLKSLIQPNMDISVISGKNGNEFESDFLFENTIDNTSNSVLSAEAKACKLTPKDLKYDSRKSNSTKSSLSANKRRAVRKSARKTAHKNCLPNDFTDMDGNKYYFI